MVGWGSELSRAIIRLRLTRGGRVALRGLAVGALAALALVGVRVLSARPAPPDLGGLLPATYPRLDGPAPLVALVDQHGERFTIRDLRGRPALVTFAFGHCETVCPLVVHNALAARRRLAERRPGTPPPALVVVTLDPWRDTPARLPTLFERWMLEEGDIALSGPVEQVNRALDAWGVVRQRDPATGDVVHPALVYVLDGSGRIAYASTGAVDQLVELMERTAVRTSSARRP
ncbi:MAG: SCO family protein [Gemmatimonadetes bacterium]|nr:MAG: SCO family protein [Gemmatimonadota bacterium]